MAFKVKTARAARLPALAALSIALAAAVAAPFSDYFARLGADFLVPLAVSMRSSEKPASDIALILIDEATHNAPPFRETPDVAWTPYLADVISAVDEAAPTVIGFDMIFPKTLATQELLPGFDRAFLAAIGESARTGRFVASELRLSETPITPYRGQVLAVGADNIRSIQLIPDADSIIRRHPTHLRREDGSMTPSFAAELAARAGASVSDGDFLIDYRTPPGSLAAYRLVDLYQCLEAGRTDVFAQFENKIVIIGTALDVEDRHVGGNRFLARKTPAIRALDCGTDASSAEITSRATIPGVYIEALAVDTIRRDNAPQLVSRAIRFGVSFAIFFAAGLIFFRLPPPIGAAVLGAALAFLWVGAAEALAVGYLTPVLGWLVGGAIVFAFVYSYRTLLEDQEKRWIRHAFQHYLSPALVDQLADHPEQLRLGGELRRAAVMFVDIADFSKRATALSGDPETLTKELNAFLNAIAAEIDSHAGYVDKFVGDAVMGVWGAPVDIDNIEKTAARAALACCEAIDRLNAQGKIHAPFAMRIGLSAGDVVAGNMGSEKRFNYTVVGDVVNLAARLEQANKQYKTTILVDDTVAEALGEEFVLRSVDMALFHGWSARLEIFELVGARGALAPEAIEQIQNFERALAAFRNREFAAAAATFSEMQDSDVLSALYFKRARIYAENPPGAAWSGALTDADTGNN